jgi:hypothetical protein
MRTQDEIVARIKARKLKDIFGFETDMYLPFLDYAHAKEFLEVGATKRKWNVIQNKASSPAGEVKDYMPFAWGKANDCRGISACRSIEHFIAWLWLDGKDWLEEDYDKHYKHYGKPQLVRICEEYGIDWKALDDDKWRSSEDGASITAEQALATKPESKQ